MSVQRVNPAAATLNPRRTAGVAGPERAASPFAVRSRDILISSNSQVSFRSRERQFQKAEDRVAHRAAFPRGWLPAFPRRLVNPFSGDDITTVPIPSASLKTTPVETRRNCSSRSSGRIFNDGSKSFDYS